MVGQSVPYYAAHYKAIVIRNIPEYNCAVYKVRKNNEEQGYRHTKAQAEPTHEKEQDWRQDEESHLDRKAPVNMIENYATIDLICTKEPKQSQNLIPAIE